MPQMGQTHDAADDGPPSVQAALCAGWGRGLLRICAGLFALGWRGSFRGDLHAYGKQAVRFYTETKTITAKWTHVEDTSKQPNMSINLR